MSEDLGAGTELVPNRSRRRARLPLLARCESADATAHHSRFSSAPGIREQEAETPASDERSDGPAIANGNQAVWEADDSATEIAAATSGRSWARMILSSS